MSKTFMQRGAFIAAAGAFSTIAILPSRARAATYSYKLGIDLNANEPMPTRLTEAADAIRKQTSGQVDISIFSRSALGTDASMLEQVRTGSLQFAVVAGSVIGQVVPIAFIDGTAFAFKDNAQACAAMDGPLGRYIRQEIRNAGLFCFERPFDSGFRQVTSSTHAISKVDDFANFKLRVAPSKMYVDMFKTLGASPVSVDLSELYTSLQTHLVDGQETPYSAIVNFRFNEVQKYLAVTNHSWLAYWTVGNADTWKALPKPLQDIVARNIQNAVVAERKDLVAQSGMLADKLRKGGMQFTAVDSSAMRARLAPYYKRWKSEFGTQAWDLLESSVGGRLA